MNPHYAAVARRAGHRCEYCRAPEAVFNFPFEVEHVVPRSRGGGDEDANLCLSCRACNLRKRDLLVYRDEATGQDVPLFHPREQGWAEHFMIDHDSGEICGTTPVGHATVACLDFNHPLQLMARQYWIRLRLFPE
jgi:hypothetical protein